MGRGLVSFTLFGNQALYTVGALRNVGIWQDGPLDVDLRFYVGPSVPYSTLRSLKYEGAQVIEVKDPEDYLPAFSRVREDQTSTFWRHAAFQGAEKDYDYVLMRDVDSRPDSREWYALNDWLDSHRMFHIIRDHPYHGVPVLAGLWGARGHGITSAAEHCPDRVPEDFYKIVVKQCNHLLVDYTSNDFYQVDQWWLRLNMYPWMRNNTLVHDPFFGFERKRFKKPLPERIDNTFIGEGFNEFDMPRFPDHRNLFPNWPRRVIGR